MVFSKSYFSSIKGRLNLVLLAFAMTFLSACSNDDDTFARLTVNGTVIVTDVSDFKGDIDASFTGNGGSASRVFSWNNNLSTADYNADVTASTKGSFQITIRDSEDIIVLNRTIQGGTEPDTIDGVTSSGTSGIWTVTIQLSSFNGDGSFSLSDGN